MQRIINIPEETFKYYVTLANKGEQIGNLERIILDGTPLPKHHGRLIDADELKRTMENDPRKALSFVDLTDFIWLAPTIIEGSDSKWKL